MLGSLCENNNQGIVPCNEDTVQCGVQRIAIDIL